jgi:excinuclease ABC subunit A
LIIQDFQENASYTSACDSSQKRTLCGTFQQIAKQGFLKVRVNGDVLDITLGMKLDRYKTHDIEIVVDRMVIDDQKTKNVNRKHQYHESR